MIASFWDLRATRLTVIGTQVLLPNQLHEFEGVRGKMGNHLAPEDDYLYPHIFRCCVGCRRVCNLRARFLWRKHASRQANKSASGDSHFIPGLDAPLARAMVISHGLTPKRFRP